TLDVACRAYTIQLSFAPDRAPQLVEISPAVATQRTRTAPHGVALSCAPHPTTIVRGELGKSHLRDALILPQTLILRASAAANATLTARLHLISESINHVARAQVSHPRRVAARLAWLRSHLPRRAVVFVHKATPLNAH